MNTTTTAPHTRSSCEGPPLCLHHKVQDTIQPLTASVNTSGPHSLGSAMLTQLTAQTRQLNAHLLQRLS